jgi:hypothetical protein
MPANGMEGITMAKDTEAQAEAKEAEPTKRVVLVGFNVKKGDLPAEVRDHPLVAGLFTAQRGGTLQMWVPVGEVEGDKGKAISAAATAENGDEIPGLYRAPSLRAWKGGEERTPPPQLKLDRKPLD